MRRFKNAYIALLGCEGFMANSAVDYEDGAYREKLVQLCKDILKEAGENER